MLMVLLPVLSGLGLGSWAGEAVWAAISGEESEGNSAPWWAWFLLAVALLLFALAGFALLVRGGILDKRGVPYRVVIFLERTSRDVIRVGRDLIRAVAAPLVELLT